MSWNLEVMCIDDAELDLDLAVPDVFGPTGEGLGFEDATSVMRDGELCAARIGRWIIIIDVSCRLSGLESHLEEVSEGRELHVFRISDAALYVHYRDGAKAGEHRGKEACRAALKSPSAKDGESVAQDLLQELTGLAWMKELWEARYQRFVLD
jgi:hypothetical protein